VVFRRCKNKKSPVGFLEIPPGLDGKRIKSGKPNIAPLQPPTLATFRSWGNSAGAGRAGLPGANIAGK